MRRDVVGDLDTTSYLVKPLRVLHLAKVLIIFLMVTHNVLSVNQHALFTMVQS